MEKIKSVSYNWRQVGSTQYRYLKKVIEDKLSDTLKQEYDQYNEFLLEVGISALPDGLYKNGEKLDYGDVRRLYDKFGEKK